MKAIPGLYDLATNPFILSMIVRALPRIAADYQGKPDHEKFQLTRTKLYDFIVEDWFNYQRMRLLAQKSSSLAKLSGSVERYLRIYSQNLAFITGCGTIGIWSICQPKEIKPILIKGHSQNRYDGDNVIASTDNGKYFFSRGADHTIKCWKLFSEKSDIDPQLEWINSGSQTLFCHGADITGAMGLSSLNAALLKQKGATGRFGSPLPLPAPSSSSSSATSGAVTNVFIIADQVNMVSAGRDIVANNSTIATNRK